MKRKNILFILTDDQGAWALGCAGNKDIKTPHIDALATTGVRFEQFFCASPVCSPARASLLTGEMPSAHGVHDWLCAGNVNTLDYPDMKDFCRKQDVAIDYLQGHASYVSDLAHNGYQCALSGKWHLGANDCPKDGFSKWFTIAGGGCPYYHADVYEDGKFSLETNYITDVITDKALSYIDALTTVDAPFYLSVHYTAPHSPWKETEHPQALRKLYATSEFTQTPLLPVHPNQINTCPVGDTTAHWRENLTGYYAAISGVDNGVGALVQKLKDTGVWEDTVIVFTSDNGMNLGQHGIWGKGNGTYPPNMYDTSVKVPLVMSHPSFLQGHVVQQMISACDIYPTLLTLADIPYTLTETQCGHNFSDLLYDQDCLTEKKIFICDEYGIARMLRTERYKLVTYSTYPEKNQFFDLLEDPAESKNRIQESCYATILANMKRELNQWFARYETVENSAEFSALTGKGQSARCNELYAFEQEMKYYWANKV